MFNHDPDLLKGVMTVDESWVYGYKIETKAKLLQLKRPEDPRPKKAHQVRSNVKVLFTVFFNCNDAVQIEFLPKSPTVNKVNWLNSAKQFINQSWILQYDNTPAHISMLVCELLAKNNTIIMPQFTGIGQRWLFPLPNTEDIDV